MNIYAFQRGSSSTRGQTISNCGTMRPVAASGKHGANARHTRDQLDAVTTVKEKQAMSMSAKLMARSSRDR